MHVLTLVIGASLMFVGIGFVIAANLQLLELQFEINQQLPKQEQFEPSAWTIFTRMRMRQLQKNVLPDSVRLRTSWQYAGVGFLAFFSGAAILLFALR